MKKILIIVCSALVCFSCTTMRQSATTTEVAMSVQQYPTVAELEVMDKVVRVDKWEWNPIKKDKIELRKGNLIASTLQQLKADILLEPQFIIEKTSYGERSITVMGYPAKYKSFRNATDKDLEAIKAVKDYNKKTKYNTASGITFLNVFSH